METPVNNIQTKVNYNLYQIIYINPISQGGGGGGGGGGVIPPYSYEHLNYSMIMTPDLSTFPKYILHYI